MNVDQASSLPLRRHSVRSVVLVLLPLLLVLVAANSCGQTGPELVRLALRNARLYPELGSALFQYSAVVSGGGPEIALTAEAEEPDAVLSFRLNDGAWQTLRSGVEGPTMTLDARNNRLQIRTSTADSFGSSTYTVVLPYPRFAFAVMSDLHTSLSSDGVERNLEQVRSLAETATAENPAPSFLVVTGDLGTLDLAEAAIRSSLGPSFPWYPVVGNHEKSDEFPANFAPIRDRIVPALSFIADPGPDGSRNTTYSWSFQNGHFIALNGYWNGTTGERSDASTSGDIPPALSAWLEIDLAANGLAHNFAFVHEPAYSLYDRGGDCLDAYPTNRDAFVAALDRGAVETLFTGHIHTYRRVDAGAYPALGSVTQVTLGRGGTFPAVSGANIMYVVVDGDTTRYRAYGAPARDSVPPFDVEDEWTAPTGIRG